MRRDLDLTVERGEMAAIEGAAGTRSPELTVVIAPQNPRLAEQSHSATASRVADSSLFCCRKLCDEKRHTT